jgi:hypothetical protein
MCQINWWLPIFDITPENCLAIHQIYFTRSVDNNSAVYNYYDWNTRNRGDAAKHIRNDTREQPKPQQDIERQEIRVVCAAGGMILFSAAHLHETVPNTSGLARYSIDFRTIHFDDVGSHKGARNTDSRCTGTTLRDCLRCADLQQLPNDVIVSYDDERKSPARCLSSSTRTPPNRFGHRGRSSDVGETITPE